MQVRHALLSSALNAAVRAGLISRNPASLVTGKPRKRAQVHTLTRCWTAEEAGVFLAHTRTQGPQVAALYALALDTGARRGELAGLAWNDVDLVAGTITIHRQMIGFDIENPVFSSTKTGAIRTITLSAQTVALLKAHKAHQAEVKMANRQHYADHGLTFAKELTSPGSPIQANNISPREFHPLCKAAKVRRIRFHDLRHTSATLLLSAGVPAHVVQQRLGHASVVMTLSTYAHALPTQQQDAASRLAALLYGTK